MCRKARRYLWPLPARGGRRAGGPRNVDLHDPEVAQTLFPLPPGTAWQTLPSCLGDGVRAHPRGGGFGRRLLPGHGSRRTHGASDDLRWHPHVHAIASRGAWDRQGRWMPVPYVDTKAAERLFRHKVFTFLKQEQLLSQERIDLLLSWRNSGFSADNSVTATPDDPEAFERLARYLLHPPVSLERMSFDYGQDKVHYRSKRNHGSTDLSDSLDPLDFLARLLMHVPEPRLHNTRYFGYYSSVSRASRQKASQEQQTIDAPAANDNLPSAAERRRLRRQWAQMLRRIFEIEPLTCRECGSEMRVISFITEPPTLSGDQDPQPHPRQDTSPRSRPTTFS